MKENHIKGLGDHLNFLARVSSNGSDLDFTGISMGFASSAGSSKVPTGECVAQSSYERPDARIPLVDGRTLHAVPGGSGTIKLTLLQSTSLSGSEAKELAWVTPEVLEQASSCRLINIDGESIRFAEVPRRSLRRVIAAVSL